MEVLVSRTGYTGEIGFELYIKAEHAVQLWNLFLETGADFGVTPCGLGSRDTLRTEAGLPLHGHEMGPERVCAGHPWMFAIDMEHDFIGKKAVNQAIENQRHGYVYPMKVNSRRKAMPGWEVVLGDNVIGHVVSGVMAPSLENTPIGFVQVDQPLKEGDLIGLKQIGKDVQLEGQIVSIPFVPGTARKKMSNFL